MEAGAVRRAVPTKSQGMASKGKSTGAGRDTEVALPSVPPHPLASLTSSQHRNRTVAGGGGASRSKAAD